MPDRKPDSFLSRCFPGGGPGTGLLFLLILSAYAAMRWIALPHMPFFNDEAIYCHWASGISLRNPSTWFVKGMDKGPYFLWLVAAGQRLWGDPLLGGRLVVFCFGLLGFFGFFALARLAAGARVALTAAALYVISPIVLVHDGLILYDSALTAWSIWGLALALWIFREGHPGWRPALALGFCSAAAAELKVTGLELAFFTVAAPWVFVAKGKRRDYWRPVLCVLAGPVLARGLMMALTRAIGLSFADAGMNNISGFLLPPWSSSPEFWMRKKWILFDTLSTFYMYWMTIPLTLTVLGIWRTWHRNARLAQFLIAWTVLPCVFFLLFAKYISPRYLLQCAVPLLFFTAAGFQTGLVLIFEWSKYLFSSGVRVLLCRGGGRFILTFLLCVCAFQYPLYFCRVHLRDPLESPYPLCDHYQYVTSWSAGPYFPKLLNGLKDICAKWPVNIIVLDSLGLLRNGLPLYKNKFEGPHPCTMSFVRDWTNEDVRSVFKPGVTNILVVDNLGDPKKWGAFQQSDVWKLYLSNSFSNPPPEAHACKVFLLEPRN